MVGDLDLGCKLNPPQGEGGSPSITRTSSRCRTGVNNCWTPSSLPLALLNRQVSCSHTLPSSSRRLSLKASPYSETSFLGHGSAPEDWGGVWLLPFLPRGYLEPGGTVKESHHALPWPETPLQTCQASDGGAALCPKDNPTSISPKFKIFFLLLFEIKGFLVETHSQHF